MEAVTDSKNNIESVLKVNNQNEIENKIRSIFRAVPVGIGVAVDRIFTEANDELCRMTGYSKEELIGKNSIMLYPTEEEYNIVVSEKNIQIIGSGSLSFETRWKKKNGEIMDIILSSCAIDNNDFSKGITFSALDITSRKISDEIILMREIELNNIAMNIPAGLFQFYLKNSGERGFEYISESSEQIFGLKNDLPDYLDQFSSRVSADYRASFIESVNHAIQNRIPWEFEGIFNKDSGESIWFRCMAKPVILEDRVVYNGLGTDITDKIKFLQLSERADKLESLALLAGGIAHDFNNILGGIFGYIEMARNYSRSDKIVRGYLDNAMQIFDRTKALTGQLLTFAKGGEPVKTAGSISQALIEVTRFLLNGSEYSYEFSFPDNLQMCEFDNEQICQAFENIIINAMESMPAGGSLHVSADNADIPEEKKSYLKPGKYIKISIKDSGTGIPGEILPKIFDPFFTTKKKCKGMGLATSHSIISRHNGYIDVISLPGHGTSFHIYLPAADKPSDPKLNGIFSEHSGKGNILIMDDEVFIRETVGEMLKLMGYNVYKATEGIEALGILEDEIRDGVIFKAVILDLTVQNGMGGKETISRIRRMGIKIPVFASSGYSDDPVISNPGDYGFTDSLRKPYRMEDLAAMLNYHLDFKRR